VADYQLYYWPEIQGRGEPIRLAFEEAGVPYDDVGRRPEEEGGGDAAIVRILRETHKGLRPFAPPVLVYGDLVIAQSAEILQWLAPRLGLVPDGERERLAAHQIQLTIADFFVEVHDVHHPIGVSLYYEDQRDEALRRAKPFTHERLPKFLAWFEHAITGDHVFGDTVSYVDLSLFQTVAGLDYAFPRAMKRLAPKIKRLRALHERIAERPRIAAYLASPRRIPFNEMGIFRHYDELDV